MASTGMFGTNNFHYVPKEIRQGALVAYVVKSSDPNIFDPLSRILLKPYKRVHDLGDFKNKYNYSEPGTIYIPGPNYGLPNDVFRDAVIGLSEKLNLGQPDGKYVMAEGCYEDGIGTEASVVNGRVQIESPFEFINQLHHNFMNQQNMHLAA
jgi:hypothetical protein